jgi:HD superfamily phosphohydrolase YqeK
MPPAVLLEAAAGHLPAWACMSRMRLEHAERVAALLGDWAAELRLSEQDHVRWRAAGFLHDALRDEAPAALRALVPEHLRNIGGPLLHGPAAAARLRDDGVADEALLRAVAYHTIGHPEFDRLGQALYIADAIEPGRRHDTARLAALRERMPGELGPVLRQVLQARMQHLLEEGKPIRSETAAFWNAVNTEFPVPKAGSGS